MEVGRDEGPVVSRRLCSVGVPVCGTQWPTHLSRVLLGPSCRVRNSPFPSSVQLPVKSRTRNRRPDPKSKSRPTRIGPPETGQDGVRARGPGGKYFIPFNTRGTRRNLQFTSVPQRDTGSESRHRRPGVFLLGKGWLATDYRGRAEKEPTPGPLTFPGPKTVGKPKPVTDRGLSVRTLSAVRFRDSSLGVTPHSGSLPTGPSPSRLLPSVPSSRFPLSTTRGPSCLRSATLSSRRVGTGPSFPWRRGTVEETGHVLRPSRSRAVRQ